MKNFVLGIGFLVAIVLLLLGAKYVDREESIITNNNQSTSTNMKITSPAFAANGVIPLRYTCDGENVNPPLAFSDIPPAAKSLALVLDDPDAPAGTWVHWIVYNISSETKEFKENNLPAGAGEGITSFGKIGYGGPCPPVGTHRYFFKLYALDTVLQFESPPNKADLEEAMSNHLLAYAELVGLYARR